MCRHDGHAKVMGKGSLVRSDWTQRDSLQRAAHSTVSRAIMSTAELRCFTKLNACSGFWQIPLSQRRRELTTFVTPFDQTREFTKMHVPASGGSDRSYTMPWWCVGTRGHNMIRDSQLFLIGCRRHIWLQEVHFVGHKINAAGAEPDPEKIRTITNVHVPHACCRMWGFIRYGQICSEMYSTPHRHHQTSMRFASKREWLGLGAAHSQYLRKSKPT